MQTEIRLHRHAATAHNGVMPRENKTEQILLRVTPSFKRDAQKTADAVGKNVTEMFTDAYEKYVSRKDVRDALAALAAKE
jgi:hypothetical protein